ncbi:hypothetical protein E4U43_000304 [Claviceps pusilla]|uniref:MFS transporter n=1 Tax=Claviceps pusilla TaxID=123648 RepID=A0A9P7SXS4_9HYPO|nr:hypothetical protein E4U43_000304 [Claviceps pusilla]
MSLAQHVTQSEGFDYAEQAGDGRPSHGDDERADETTALLSTHRPPKRKWRYMKFGLGYQAEPEHQVAAYEISVARRCVQVATGIIACWLCAGIVFGFAALKPILVSEGLYADLCDTRLQTPMHALNMTKYIKRLIVPCDEQDLRLNLFFVVASVTANVSSLLAGSVLDTLGRRTCWLIACILLIAGSLLFTASFAVPEMDSFLIANALLSMGGTFIFVSSFQLVNAFPMYSGALVAVMTGAFDASSAVFLIYGMTYEATSGNFSLRYFFLAYTAIPILIVIAEMAYMPPHPYHTMSNLEHIIGKVEHAQEIAHQSERYVDEAVEPERVQEARARADLRTAKLGQLEDLAGNAIDRHDRRKLHEDRQTVSGVWGVLHGASPRRQMLSPWFILILLLTAIQMLRMNYFIATIRAQYRYMLDSEHSAAMVNSFFDIALPVAGVASTPLVGVLLNNLSVPSIFGIVTMMIAVEGALNCLPYLWAGCATVIAFVIFRPLYYSAVSGSGNSDYATKVFGFKSFGRIYGTIVCCSGLINLAQSGLDAVTHEVLGGNPTPINIAFVVTGTVVGSTLSIFVAIQSRSSKMKRISQPHA